MLKASSFPCSSRLSCPDWVYIAGVTVSVRSFFPLQSRAFIRSLSVCETISDVAHPQKITKDSSLYSKKSDGARNE